MALHRKKSPQSLPMWHFRWDGQRAGRFLILQRRFGRKMLTLTAQKQVISRKWFFRSESLMTPLRNSLQVKAIFIPYQQVRWEFIMLPLSPVAEIIGIFIRQKKAVDRYLSVLQEEATIRNGAKMQLK